MEPLPPITKGQRLQCEQCNEPLYLLPEATRAPIVEWLSTEEGLSLADTIRAVHTSCRYVHTHYDRMEEDDLYDFWLPMYEIEELYDIVIDRLWDDVAETHKKFAHIHKEAHK